MCGHSRPVLARKARLRLDRHAGTLLLLYPERGMALNASAGVILELCTGEHTIDEIVDCVAGRTARPTVERDVLAFLSAMAARGLVRCE